jgi:hypothetical protein
MVENRKAINCEEVWREVSNYLDGEVDPILRASIEEHIRGCHECAAVVEGTRNVIQLYGDERMLEVPLGFSHRLEQRLLNQQVEEQLEKRQPPNRRSFLGWMAAAAAACLVAGAIEVSRSSLFREPQLRAQMAQPGNGVPPDMVVLVSEEGKLFHVAGCPFIHDKKKLRTMTATEATLEGYAPCVRCMKKYLAITGASG